VNRNSRGYKQLLRRYRDHKSAPYMEHHHTASLRGSVLGDARHFNWATGAPPTAINGFKNATSDAEVVAVTQWGSKTARTIFFEAKVAGGAESTMHRMLYRCVRCGGSTRPAHYQPTQTNEV
jgi:hypothetical protein